MKLVSWNVNSIKARKDHVARYLAEEKPDVLMLQELKGLDFPDDILGDYTAQTVPQKAYNGVAMISKHLLEVVHKALPGDENDEQARYLECNVNGLRVINIYLPNGNPVEDGNGEKFLYKLRWMDRLYKRLKDLRTNRVPFVIGGDFNIIPKDKDCHDPEKWRGDALFHEKSLKKFLNLKNLGLIDTYRIFDQASEKYTFWDYQAGAWQKNNGIRIDHFLTSPELTDKIISCKINEEPRGWDRPSDHTPIALTLQQA